MRARGGYISIHAPRTGSDNLMLTLSTETSYFNPRSPHGERLIMWRRVRMSSRFQSTLPARGATRTWSPEENKVRRFQSTLPARGATRRCADYRVVCRISIHAPRTGSDEHLSGVRAGRRDFNPRSPHGERRPRTQRTRQKRRHFNPRSPHGERRGSFQTEGEVYPHFNPRSPHGERRSRTD